MLPDDFPDIWKTPFGRLSNGFYRIGVLGGRNVPFFPRAGQKRMLDLIYRKGYRRIVAPKARKIGFSTLFSLVALEAMLLNPGTKAAIVDKTLTDAQTKLADMVCLSHRSLPAPAAVAAIRSNSTQLELANGSWCHVGISFRGGTPDVMLISEWGKVSHSDPTRSLEIKTGALGSCSPLTLVINESTGMGKNNDFHDCVKQAQEVPDAQKTTEDWRLCFASWWEEASNVICDAPRGRVSKDTNEYLDEVERRAGCVITPAQRAWYQVRAVEAFGLFRFREHPSFVEEIFEAPVEGAIYGDLLGRLRADGHISRFSYDSSLPCYCAWDLGFRDSTNIWWFQLVGNVVHVVKHVCLLGYTAGMAADVVVKAAMPVALHLLPHDACHHHASNTTFHVAEATYMGALLKCGLRNLRAVPRTVDIWLGINAVRSLLPRCYFDAVACASGISALETYHVDGPETERPVHDASSNAADAFRMIAEAMNAGLISPHHAGRRPLAAPAGRAIPA
jgi:hypothetical protein